MTSAVLASVAALTAAILLILVSWRKTARRKRQDQEQIDRKLKEDALDRALSNRQRTTPQPQAHAPMAVHYKSKPQKETGTMLRLTEQAESITKEYLFRRTDIIFLGEEYGSAAVFQERENNKIDCEIFPYKDGVYARRCGETESRILRGRSSASLTSKAVRLRSGDRIETRMGIFLVEFI